jgi:hypothetical protein
MEESQMDAMSRQMAREPDHVSDHATLGEGGQVAGIERHP